ncbi:hypothetical protein MCOR02_001061 [Pyricularia oryzae]|uniref:Uncharacterized protein n=1 Tax=Pyricularia oryzae TaxID=318829 RepID=A0A4P7NV20_PYROR|nr:hypothetical protein MCOR02_001061 [Pyricularia oryzae]KAI6309872.1 hypothetical protein MCOR34_006599 [Pyricularia oryzae]KAI6450673.1 hypothetical protein MCOR17_009859 [Pyricularia oryzae]KAI6501381.1 hypothetical protein MCOR13_005641 [Pyricularia oryzae]KAI6551090.1 hypothetical protein MCOR04_011142 [Pyricularia oryzae]
MLQSPVTDTPHTCATCGKQYQRTSHLRRHELTHAGDTGFRCPFCDKVFARRDVCRKHSLHCPLKGTSADPPLAKRGQKPRACDACFRSRLACDNDLPCSRCLGRSIQCSYARLNVPPAKDGNVITGQATIQRSSGPAAQATPRRRAAFQTKSSSPVVTIENGSVTEQQHHAQYQQLPTPLTLASPSPTATQRADTPREPDGDEKMAAASFLLSLTNPQSESMVKALINEPGRDEAFDDTSMTGGDAGASSSNDASSNLIPPDVDLAADAALLTGASFFPWSMGSQPMDLGGGCGYDYSTPEAESPPAPGRGACDMAQQAACAAMVAALEETHARLVVGGRVGGEEDGACEGGGGGVYTAGLAAEVLAPGNVRAFVARYFRNAHLDFPLLHRASFAVETAAPELLLAVLLCGSLYMPPTDSALSARNLFDLAEELAFRRLAVGLAAAERADGGGGEGPVACPPRLYETLQAALIVHALQSTMRSSTARRRNRTVRLPALVSAVRVLGLAKTKHAVADLMMMAPEARWAQFVQAETRIRIATWTLLSDCQQSGVFHCPQLMTTLEMTGSLPCLPELWNAASHSELDQVICASGRDSLVRGASIRVAVETLMAENWDGPEAFPVKPLTLPDLQVLVFSIHSSMRNARFASILPAAAPVVARAIDRWQELWDLAARGLTAEELSRRGLVRHSGELCWLARVMLDVSMSEDAERSSAYLQGVAHDSLEELHAFLRIYCSLDD